MNQAIRSLQAKTGVPSDGMIGPNTVKAFAGYYKLSPAEAAHFLGQCHHESGGFVLMVENLNYSAKRLRAVFPKYFDEIQAKYAANNPEAIANRVYANRMGNGDVSTGDGWRHRGRGPLQLTGKNNQTAFLRSMGRDSKDVDLISTELAFESAIWFFRENNIFRYCDRVNDESILKVSRAVNLGNPNSTAIPHGLEDREKWTKYYYRILA